MAEQYDKMAWRDDDVQWVSPGEGPSFLEILQQRKEERVRGLAQDRRFKQMFSKGFAKYECPAKNIEKRCAVCDHWRVNESCEVVLGRTRENAWCQFFTPEFMGHESSD